MKSPNSLVPLAVASSVLLGGLASCHESEKTSQPDSTTVQKVAREVIDLCSATIRCKIEPTEIGSRISLEVSNLYSEGADQHSSVRASFSTAQPNPDSLESASVIIATYSPKKPLDKQTFVPYFQVDTDSSHYINLFKAVSNEWVASSADMHSAASDERRTIITEVDSSGSLATETTMDKVGVSHEINHPGAGYEELAEQELQLLAQTRDMLDRKKY